MNAVETRLEIPPGLLAPDVFPIELAHSITRTERQGRITSVDGARHITDALSTLPILHSSLSLLPIAYAMSSQMRIGVYDYLYVALMDREGCELVAADERLQRSLPGYRIVLLSAL